MAMLDACRPAEAPRIVGSTTAAYASKLYEEERSDSHGWEPDQVAAQRRLLRELQLYPPLPLCTFEAAGNANGGPLRCAAGVPYRSGPVWPDPPGRSERGTRDVYAWSNDRR